MAPQPFQFKRFRVDQTGAAHPVGTDGVLLGAWADVRAAGQVLDIGTGTGLIALMLAQRTEYVSPPVHITGVEIHGESCHCARQNMMASPWKERLSVVQSSIQSFAGTAQNRFDLIVSNPPFFTGTMVSADAGRRQSRHAASLRLVDLMACVRRLLAGQGRFCAILPPQAGQWLCEWGPGAGLYCTRYTAVYTRKGKPVERLLLQFELNPYPFERSEIVVQTSGESQSELFKALTGAFYL